MARRTALIMTGGTGGHIFPALAVADELKSRGWTLVFLGAEGGMETKLVPQHGYTLETLPMRGMRGNGLRRWLSLPWMLARALAGAATVIFRTGRMCRWGLAATPAFPAG